MTNKEAIKYLIVPIATSTGPSTEYLKLKEAYELAIKALEDRPQGEWIFHKDYNERKYGCNQCGNLNNIPSKYCPNCGVKMKGGAK